jgi:anti-sigma B factor antagonist
MPATTFEASVRRQLQATIIDMRGEFDAGAEAALNSAYDMAERVSATAILLNFTQVTYINSAGVSLVIELLGRSNKSRRRIAAYGLSSHYTKIFQITRLVDYMTISPDESTAISALFG